jgi:GT2 family glycosyltransferase
VTPLVSIVMPCFNHAAFVDEAIRSVLGQTWPNIELIVIDGGSTDGSVEIIRRHADRLAYWVSEKDAGQADAINKGFRHAKGDVLAWLNSDDLYFPDAVAQAVGALGDAALVYGDAVCVNERGEFLRYFTEVEPFDAWRLCNCADFIMQPATFFTRAAFECAGPLDPTLRWCLDWDLWCRLSRVGAVRYLPQPLAANREHGSTKTATGGADRLREVLQLHRRHGTTRWPHAYCSFAAKQARTDGRRLAHLAWSLAGWRNVLHARRHRRAIGGLRHGDHRCSDTLRIAFPVYRPARAVRVSLRTPDGAWHREFHVHGHAVDLTLNIGRHPTHLDRVTLVD